MRRADAVVREDTARALDRYEAEIGLLPGLVNEAHRRSLIEQIVESYHRWIYPQVVADRDISPRRANPLDPLFDPLRAAILKFRSGDFEEACWLVFLLTHFGRHARYGWRYVAQVYGRLGVVPGWTWNSICADVAGFRLWLSENELAIRNGGGGFGNHRKYESLNGRSENGTGAVVESYVTWVQAAGGHQELFLGAGIEAGENPGETFDVLYRSMGAVRRFGRTARFDYLTMLGKLGLGGFAPGRTYLAGSTGPLRGARLLFDDVAASTEALEANLITLDSYLCVGAQVLEDSICNWQKNPAYFKPFRG